MCFGNTFSSCASSQSFGKLWQLSYHNLLSKFIACLKTNV
jgi:hypothetical protein